MYAFFNVFQTFERIIKNLNSNDFRFNKTENNKRAQMELYR